jgi:hypothetical protein
LNFDGVPAFRKRSHQFPKIQSSADLQKYEFRLAHLYAKFGSSFTNMTWFLNIQNSWPVRDIKRTIMNPLVLKLGLGVLHDGLLTFLFYLVDMLKPAPKIQEVIEFQK